MITRCLQCNKEFNIRPSRIKVGAGKFCSMSCYSIVHSKRQKEIKGWKHKKETIIKMKNKAIFNKNWSKENNPFWKGGVSPINRIIRSSKEYKLWRNAVLERDNYTCIWCKSNQNLQADHIKRFSDFPELRFAIDNGRTLCLNCHKTTDTWGN